VRLHDQDRIRLVFDDHVEIWSTGTFPRGITPEKLKRRHPSVLR